MTYNDIEQKLKALREYNNSLRQKYDDYNRGTYQRYLEENPQAASQFEKEVEENSIFSEMNSQPLPENPDNGKSDYDRSYSEGFFDTKSGGWRGFKNNLIGGIYWLLNGGGDKVDESKNNSLNAWYDFVGTAEDMHASNAAGGMELNNNRIKALKEWNDYLASEVRAAQYKQELDALSPDDPRYGELSKKYGDEVVKQELLSSTGQLRSITNVAYSVVSDQKTPFDQIKANLNAIKKLEKQNVNYAQDLEWARGMKNATDAIYTLPESWEKNKADGKFWYNLPSAMGSSLSSIGSTVATAAGAQIASGISSAALASASKAAPVVAIGAAALGITNGIYQAIYARDLESRAEVASNYEHSIRDYCDRNGIDFSQYMAAGREALRKKTGLSYSEDKNDVKGYRSNEEVLADMLAYDIPIGNPDIDKETSKARKTLQGIYDRNMSLATLDIAENFMVVPGMGKLTKRALEAGEKYIITKPLVGTANVLANADDYLVKYIDKGIAASVKRATGKEISAVAAKRMSKYIEKPLVKGTLVGVAEGGEEVTQSVLPIEERRRVDAGEERRPDEWFSLRDPSNNFLFNSIVQFGENNVALFKGYANMLGLNTDAALDDADLWNAWKLGFAVAGVTGAVTRGYSDVRNLVDYQKGVNIARHMYADKLLDQEDMQRYSQYAQYARTKGTRDALIDGINTQIDDNAMPTGWTKEMVTEEKNRINDAFQKYRYLKKDAHNIMNAFMQAYPNFDDVPEGLTKDQVLDATVAFMVKTQKDYNEARDKYNKFIARYNTKNGDTEINKLLDSLAPSDLEQKTKFDANRQLFAAYLKTRAASEGVQAMMDQLKQVGESAGITTRNKFDALAKRQAELQTLLNKAVAQYEQSIGDKTTADATLQQYYKLFDGAEAIAHNESILLTLQQNLQDTKNKFQDFNQFHNRKAYTDSTTDSLHRYFRAMQENDETNRQIQNAIDQNGPTPSTDDESRGGLPATTGDNDPFGPEDRDTRLPDTPGNGGGGPNGGQPTGPNTGGTDNNGNNNDGADNDNSSNNGGLPSTTEDKTPEKPSDTEDEDNPAVLDDGDLDKVDFDNDNYHEDYGGESDETRQPAGTTNPKTPQNDGGGQAEQENQGESEHTENQNNEQPDEKPKPVEKPVTTPDDPRKVEIPGKGDIENSLKYDINDDSQEDENLDTSMFEVFYAQDSSRPLLPTYKSGKSLAAFLATIDKKRFAELKFTAMVMDETYKHGVWDRTNPNTYGNATIFIVINAGADGKFLVALKTNAGYEAYLRKRFGETADISKQLDAYINLRNTIIQAVISGSTVTFDQRKLYNGKPNNVPGGHFLIPYANWCNFNNAAGNPDTTFTYIGIGTGIAGKFVIKGLDGIPKNGRGGSGKIYAYTDESHTPQGNQVPIKLNEIRFQNADGSTNDFARILARACMYNQTDFPGITSHDLLALALNYGKSTLVNPADPRYPFLKNKQFFFDYKSGKAYLGDQVFNITDLRNEKGEQFVADFIAQNLHWNTEKDLFTTPIDQVWFDYMRDNNLKELTLMDTGEYRITITEDDKGKPVLQWMLEQGVLWTDVDLKVPFAAPFLYVGSPSISKPADEVVEEATAETAKKDPSLTFEQFTKKMQTVNEGDAEEPGANPAEDDHNDNSRDDDSLASDQPTGPVNETPTDDTKSDVNIGDDTFNNFMGFDAGPTKIMSDAEFRRSKRINTVKARRWLKKTLGLNDEQVEIVNGVLRQFTNGSAVYGQAHIDSITLSDLAAEGVQYHEAFHRVSLLMLSPVQRKEMYIAYRKQHPEYIELSDKELEERLADEFMDFMIQNSSTGLRYQIAKLFRNIKSFIGLNSKFKPTDLHTVFNAIRFGDFSNYKLNQQSIDEFKKAYSEGPYYKIGSEKNVELKYFKDSSQFRSALESLKACLFLANGAKNISDIKQLSNTKLLDFIKKFQKSNFTTAAQKDALQEIIDNFDAFLFELGPLIKQMGVRQIDQNENEDIEERETTGIADYDKAPYEINRKQNALTAARIFLSTLVKQDFAIVEKNGAKIRTLKTVINETTGLPEVNNYDEVYARVVNELSGVETFNTSPGKKPETSLVGKCAQLAKTDRLFATLYHRLQGNVDLVTQTQLLQTIKCYSSNMLEVTYTKDGDNVSFSVNTANGAKQQRAALRRWSANFFNSANIITSNGKTELNKNSINSAIAEFNRIQAAFNDTNNIADETAAITALTDLTKLLNSIGIDVTYDAMVAACNNDLLNGVRNLVLSHASGSLYYLFNSTLPQLLNGPISFRVNGITRTQNLTNIFDFSTQNSTLARLAKAYVETTGESQSLQVIGPNGAMLYTKTQNCYITDIVRLLNLQDEKVLTQLNADPYCQGSLLLNAANNGTQLRVGTFINFYGNEANDSGRDFISISPTEDYLAKMTLTRNNYIIFPTMADKKTYYSISGCKLFNDPLQIIPTSDEHIHFRFNERVLNYLYNAWKAEFETIIQYYKTLPDVKVPIANYHTAGKGGLFRHFTGCFLTENGERRWYNLNNVLKDAVKNGTVNETLEMIKQQIFSNPMETKDLINQNLSATLRVELKKCQDYGIIEYEGSLVKNKLLDTAAIAGLKEFYTPMVGDDASVLEHLATTTLIGNYIANHQVSLLETEKIITGDSAFFKNDKDRIKRLGSVQSTGDNLRTEWSTNVPEDQVEAARMNRQQTYTTVTLADNEIVSRQVGELKQLFFTSNLYDSLKQLNLTEENIKDLMHNPDSLATDDDYKQLYFEAVASAKQAADLYGLSKPGKGAINQADAAVYVSPRMYQNILEMLGEWNSDVAEAFRIMEESDNWMSDATLYAKTLKTLIKPLKTTYFGYSYNADLGRNIPVFNKMAMFPLFKCLANNDLKDMYERMTSTGKYKGLPPVDQFAFESAVKVGIQGKVKYYTDLNNNQISDLTNIPVTKQEYRFLRRQLITDPHTHDRMLFGTQVSTIAVSNLIFDHIYKDGTDLAISGSQIATDLFGTMNSLSKRGSVAAIAQVTENGRISMQKVSSFLQKESRGSDMGVEMEQMLGYNSDNNDLNVPLSALPNSSWIESKLTSLFQKKAIDLELPGGAFIQRSSFGVGQIGVEGNRLLNIRKDGSMDCVISINLLKHIIPNAYKLSFDDQVKWLTEHNIIGENAGPIAMGYRIPTQGLSSVAPLHIKAVLPSNVGDTIILPDEFTTQTGSDFDIDKLYVVRYNYDKDGKKIQFVRQKNDESFDEYLHRRFAEERGGEYAEGQEAAVIKLFDSYLESLGISNNEEEYNEYDANSREACENLLLDAYMAVLTDNSNVNQTRLPLDKVTGIVKDEILPIVDGPAQDTELIPFEELTPSYHNRTKQEYYSGKIGLAPFALNNKNHVLTQLMGLTFNKKVEVMQALGLTGLNGIESQRQTVRVRDKYGVPVGEDVTVDDAVKILDWLSAMINAHVDVAKDPYVARFNITMYTINVCNLLLRAGFGKSTFFFMPQQILKDLSTAKSKSDGIYGVDNSRPKYQIFREERQKVIQHYIDEYNKTAGTNTVSVTIDRNKLVITDNKLGEISVTDICKRLMNEDALIDNLRVGGLYDTDRQKWLLNQLMYLKVFDSLLECANDLSKLVQLSQIDTKKFGKDFVSILIFKEKIRQFQATQTLFNKDELARYYEQSFLMPKFEYGAIAALQVFSGIMLQSNESFLADTMRLLECTPSGIRSSEATVKKLKNALLAQKRLMYYASPDNRYATNTVFAFNGLATRLSNILADIRNGKYPELGDVTGVKNALLRHLTVIGVLPGEEVNLQYIARYNLNNDDSIEIGFVKDAWQELLDSQIQEIKQFAQDLVDYTFLTTGGNPTKNGLFGLLPRSVFTDTLSTSFRQQVSGGNITTYSQFMDAVNDAWKFHSDEDLLSINFALLNNWSDNNIIPTVGNNLVYASKHPDSVIMYTRRNGQQIAAVFTGDNTTTTPFVKIRYGSNIEDIVVYRNIGHVVDDTGMSISVYGSVSKLGYNKNGKLILERGVFQSEKQSIFGFNNVEIPFLQAAENTKDVLFSLTEYLMTPANKKFYQSYESRPIKNVTPIPYNGTQPNTNAIPTLKAEEVGNGGIVTTGTLAQGTAQKDTGDINIKVESGQATENTLTFKNGFVAHTPFKLNDQQVGALLTLEQFANNPDAFGNTITLSGYAGTGKTSIINIFKQFLEARGCTVKFSTPTHRANAVLAANNVGDVMTLHSLLGLSPMVDLTSEYDLRRSINQKVRKPRLQLGDWLIIDESSMIGNTLYELISSTAAQFGANVIFMGDIAQLPSVGNDGISPVFKNVLPSMQLTKVERTGNNPILAEATRLREGKDISYISAEKNGGSVLFATPQQENSVIQTELSNCDFNSNPLCLRIVSATNNGVAQLNKLARELRFGKDVPQLVVGDILMGYSNSDMIKNSIDYIVEKVSELTVNDIELSTDGEKVQLEGYVCRVKPVTAAGQSAFQIFIVSKNANKDNIMRIVNKSKQINQDISRFYTEGNFNLAQAAQKKLSELTRAFVLMENVEVNGRLIYSKGLDYGYAHTIHKSQGGTYDKVIIQWDSIGAPFDAKTQQALKYVAVTRAKSKVVIITNRAGYVAQKNQPVDFADAWSQKEGWSVEHFNKNVMPRINEAYQAEYELYTGDQKPQFRMKMVYAYNSEARPGLKAKTTFEAIKTGERTATTRYVSDGHYSYWSTIKKGDIVEFIDANNNTVKVKITKPFTALSATPAKGLINDSQNTQNDPERFATEKESAKTLKSKNGFLTNAEARAIRPFTGDTPVVAVASEHTDPVFFVNQIIEVLDGKRSIFNRVGKKFSGKDINALYIITKHDGLPMKKLLQYPIPKWIHFSISGLGGTKYEPHVLPYTKMLDAIEGYIKEGLDPNMVTVRIDPIVPGVTKRSDIEQIIKRCAAMGVHIRFSVMDQYKTTAKYMEALGYDYSKFYNVVNRNVRDAKPEVIQAIAQFVVNTAKKYGVKEVSSCAENINIPGVKKEGCLSANAVNNMLGTSLELPEGGQRGNCSCFGGKIDMLKYSDKCLSGCGYCYAHHNSPLGKEVKKEIADMSMPVNNDPKSFTLHSGGAVGADTWFAMHAQQRGSQTNAYYYGEKTPTGNYEISREDYEEGVVHVRKANETLGRKNIEKYMNLLARDWIQVKYSDAVFAVSTLQSDKTVNGGTGWAVQMAIDVHKPVFVFDQNKNSWFQFDYNKGVFVAYRGVPDLTTNFAGIGTRELNKLGSRAIDKLFEKAFGTMATQKQVSFSQQYEKTTPEINSTTGIVFTENAQACAAVHGLSLPQLQQFGNPLLNVSAGKTGTNMACVRTNSQGITNPNSFGIVVKKAQQDSTGKWLTTEGQFQDTDEDFELFKKLNTAIFNEIGNSPLQNITFPTSMAMGKAALPSRFVDWLIDEFKLRYGITAVKKLNRNPQYNGYGLEFMETSVNVYAETGDNAELSNLAIRPFEYTFKDGSKVEYNSVEQAFQHIKTRYSRSPHALYTAQQIMGEEDPSMIRRIGRSLAGLDTAKWDQISSKLLYYLMLYSFQQNPEAQKLLLNTGDKIITHQVNGIEQDGGRFSKLLTMVRTKLQEDNKQGEQIKNICKGE